MPNTSTNDSRCLGESGAGARDAGHETDSWDTGYETDDSYSSTEDYDDFSIGQQRAGGGGGTSRKSGKLSGAASPNTGKNSIYSSKHTRLKESQRAAGQKTRTSRPPSMYQEDKGQTIDADSGGCAVHCTNVYSSIPATCFLWTKMWENFHLPEHFCPRRNSQSSR
jgi:hypothetical protein